MSIYRRPEEMTEGLGPVERMAADIADLLTGPTSGGNGDYLARSLTYLSYPTAEEAEGRPGEVAARLIEIAERYLAAKGEGV